MVHSNEHKPHIVVLSGAGISAESGIPTFRGADGLWEGHDIMEVASPEGWRKNQELVLDFYNQRRKAIMEAAPNEGHQLIASLERDFKVSIITQNIDDLHERAGSTNVLHLHGEINKARSTKDASLIYDLKDWRINVGDNCEKGGQLRPHIVWFGEAVPMIVPAYEITQTADILIVIGTSLQVYPAASLVDAVSSETPIYVIDPQTPAYQNAQNIIAIKEVASKGMKVFISLLKQ